MGRSIYPSGMACFFGHDVVERRSGRSDARSVDAHDIERFGVHDVEAATSIHQYLGELLHVDDRVDHERISPRLRDALWVVGPIKGWLVAGTVAGRRR